MPRREHTSRKSFELNVMSADTCTLGSANAGRTTCELRHESTQAIRAGHCANPGNLKNCQPPVLAERDAIRRGNSDCQACFR